MSLSTQYEPDYYVGDGTLTDYAFNWRILAKSDLVVITRDEDLVVTVLELDSDYTIADADVNNSAGGEIVLATELAANTELWLIRSTALTQLVNITEGSAFPAATICEVFDRLTMMIQELNYIYRKTLHFADASTFVDMEVPEPTNSLLLQWSSLTLANSTGASIIVEDLPTADPGIPGQLWNDLGTVKVSI